MQSGWYWATYLVDNRREIVFIQLTHNGDDIIVFRSGCGYEYRVEDFKFHGSVKSEQ